MIFTLGTTNVRTKAYGSLEALEHDLVKCDAGSIYAGQKKDLAQFFNLIAVTDAESGDYFGLGLLTATAKEPHLLVTGNNMLFVGADNFACLFDIEQKTVRAMVPLPGDYADFFYLEDKGIVLIVHKKGVIAKDEEGNDIWRASRGLLAGYAMEDGMFTMELASGRTIGLKVKNGKEVDIR